MIENPLLQIMMMLRQSGISIKAPYNSKGSYVGLVDVGDVYGQRAL